MLAEPGFCPLHPEVPGLEEREDVFVGPLLEREDLAVSLELALMGAILAPSNSFCNRSRQVVTTVEAPITRVVRTDARATSLAVTLIPPSVAGRGDRSLGATTG